MQKSSSSSNSNSDLVVPICALKPLDSVIWQAFVKYQDDPVKQMKRLTTEQVQSILLLIAIFELRSCGKSLSGSEQGTLILDQYQKMLAMWVKSDFIYRCDKKNIESNLQNTLRKTTSDKILAKAKRIKLDFTKCYAIWKSEALAPKSGECFKDVLEKFNICLKVKLTKSKDDCDDNENDNAAPESGDKFHNVFPAFCWFGPSFNPTGLEDESSSIISKQSDGTITSVKNKLPSGREPISRNTLRQ